jgi:uncharacterized protein (TIGR02246 family)
MEDDEFPFKDEEPRIRKIIQEQESAWNAASARRYCARIRMDASLTSIQGGVYDGREAIEGRMFEVFANVFKGTRISMKIQRIRFEGNLAMVEIDTEVNAVKTLPPGIRASADGKLRTRLLEVMVNDNNTWSILALHDVDVKTP